MTLPRHASPWPVVLLLLLIGPFPSLFSQDDEKKGAGDPGKESEKKQAEEKFSPEQKEVILALFSASKVEFTKEGKVRIIYQYGKNWSFKKGEDLGSRDPDDALVMDWTPPMEKTKQRIRWVGALESARDGAIMVAEQGKGTGNVCRPKIGNVGTHNDHRTRR